ncbi:helix-turn-helix transcriptional regulator [Lacticaseibacillus daqingensis]|uniref:helix-turn-helix transcriptional regulator n=1 Tax=Lacticaseibacillus daqingensis TaxID=2486014 RepID=UPI0013DE499C|nr:helix-turn-helix transcriptional regulator [Lacticaseibacillus daqingensis]
MEIGKQIQTHRQRLGLTQDMLADKLLVSRQTISNWENDRHYPDIENLLLLSQLFGTSLDELVKGDVPMMKHKVFIDTTNRDVKWMLGLTTAGALALGPALFLPWPWVLVPPLTFFALAMIPAIHIDILKHNADVHTYKEIMAYMNGRDMRIVKQNRNWLRDTWSQIKIMTVFTLIFLLLALLASLPFMLLGHS